jgi:hypothetical protein
MDMICTNGHRFEREAHKVNDGEVACPERGADGREVIDAVPEVLLNLATAEQLSTEQAVAAASRFVAAHNRLVELAEEAASLDISKINDPKEIKRAHDGRMEAVRWRTGAAKDKDFLKADALKYGRGVSSVFNYVEREAKDAEAVFDAFEHCSKRREEERVAALKAEREALLAPYVENIGAHSLGYMTQEAFDDLLAGQKLIHAKKAEDERVAREAADRAADEQRAADEAMRAENARLRAESAAKQKLIDDAAAAERERVAAERRAEQAKDDAEAQAAEEAKKLRLNAAYQAFLEANGADESDPAIHITRKGTQVIIWRMVASTNIE